MRLSLDVQRVDRLAGTDACGCEEGEIGYWGLPACRIKMDICGRRVTKTPSPLDQSCQCFTFVISTQREFAKSVDEPVALSPRDPPVRSARATGRWTCVVASSAMQGVGRGARGRQSRLLVSNFKASLKFSERRREQLPRLSTLPAPDDNRHILARPRKILLLESHANARM